MGWKSNKTSYSTIEQCVHDQFKKQAVYTGSLFILISAVVFLASIKFSTDRYVGDVCDDVNDSARLLIETSQLPTYRPYFNEIANKLQKELSIGNISVIDRIPPIGLLHYSIGNCSLEWRSDLKTSFYTPTNWGGETLYVTSLITPRFFRSDLLIFIIAVSFLLFISYFFGTRSILRNIEQKISIPIHDVWDGFRTGNPPKHLAIQEIRDLWNSLTEFKELLMVKNRMFLAKEYYHEVKSPAFYQFNQLKRLKEIDDPDRQKDFIESTLNKAEVLIDEMEKALKKIAHDDYARFPKAINLSELVKQKDSKFLLSEAPVFITGDKTLIKTLLQNLYSNAVEECGSIKNVSTELKVENNEVVLIINNPTQEERIDTTEIFRSGFTSKLEGTGLGLALSKHIVEIHKGMIEANHSPKNKIFQMIVRFPIREDSSDGNS